MQMPMANASNRMASHLASEVNHWALADGMGGRGQQCKCRGGGDQDRCNYLPGPETDLFTIESAITNYALDHQFVVFRCILTLQRQMLKFSIWEVVDSHSFQGICTTHINLPSHVLLALPPGCYQSLFSNNKKKSGASNSCPQNLTIRTYPFLAVSSAGH
jgi:hypothetical protein